MDRVAPVEHALAKAEFISALRDLAERLTMHVSDNCGNWAVKGFIDSDKNVYSVSADTKIISKLLEIQLFPLLKDVRPHHGLRNRAGGKTELVSRHVVRLPIRQTREICH